MTTEFQPHVQQAIEDIGKRITDKGAKDYIAAVSEKRSEAVVALEKKSRKDGLFLSVAKNHITHVVGTGVLSSILTAAMVGGDKPQPQPQQQPQPVVVPQVINRILPPVVRQRDVVMEQDDKSSDPNAQIMSGPMEWIISRGRQDIQPLLLVRGGQLGSLPISAFSKEDRLMVVAPGPNSLVASDKSSGSTKKFVISPETTLNTFTKVQTVAAAVFDANGVKADMEKPEFAAAAITYHFEYVAGTAATEKAAAVPDKIRVIRDIGQDGVKDANNAKDWEQVISIDIK